MRRSTPTFVIAACYLGNVSDTSRLGVSALINLTPNTEHVTLTMLNTRATLMQI
jgi:hypothetical protein